MRLADKTSLLGPAAISWVWVLPGEPGPGAWITLLLESSLAASTGPGRSWGPPYRLRYYCTVRAVGTPQLYVHAGKSLAVGSGGRGFFVRVILR